MRSVGDLPLRRKKRRGRHHAVLEKGTETLKKNTISALKAGAAPFVLGLAMITAPALAQDTAATEAAESDEVIVVTGSRIINAQAESASPLQIVSAEQIDDSGSINIQDLLLENPILGTPTFSRTNTAFATAGAGVATVDLRNLGVDRTLVLINGRRVVSGVPGSNAVDLNIIPTQFLERVDILTGGASAVYGSDAVAGVINFVYKKNFDGIELNAQTGISERGDGRDTQANLLVGKNFAEGRGNIMAFAGYSKQGTVLKKNRSTEAGSMALDATSLGLAVTGLDQDLFTPFRPNFSGFAPQGRYYTDNFTFTFDKSGALRPCASRSGGTCDLSGTPLEGSALDGTQIGPDGFNRSDFRYLAVPVERYIGAVRADFEISPALKFFVEGNYARTKVSTIIEPFPLASDDIFPDSGGQVPIESNVAGIIYRNPFVPDAIYSDASDSDGDGLRDIFFDKRLADFGGRASQAKRDTFRIAGGITGEVFKTFNYEVYGVYGQSKEAQTGSGQFNQPNFQQALNAIRDVNDINGNGNRSEIICANAAARAAGCTPANIYGVGTLAPALAYLAAPQTLDTKVTQFVTGASLSGQLFSLGTGAGPVSIAVGGEFRRETSDSRFDMLSQLGLNGGNALPATTGKFDVLEGYAEAIVPLLADRPFFHDLSIRGAVRVSDYSTVGRTFSYNYGAEWAPVEDIRFRAMKARSVRAPNVSELFSPPQQDFPPGLVDPCIDVTAAATGALATNCRAAVGVNANIAANGAFAASQADLQGITSFAGGNPALTEEKGDSFTAGVVITPKSLGIQGLTLTVDYFNIKIAGAIVDTPLQFILDQCYNQSNTALCDFIVRRPNVQGPNNAGSLDEVNSGPSNSGGLGTSGIDATLGYRHDFGDFDLGVRVAYTHLLKGFLVPLPGAASDEFAGEIGASKERFTTNLSLGYRNFGLTLTGTYIGKASLDDQLVGAKPGTNPLYDIAAEFYLDAQMRFKVEDRFEFYMGADNLLDNKPPFLADLQDEAGGIDTASGTYDALGRRFYAGFRIKY